MTDTIITVQGRFSSFSPPERATVRLSVGFEGPDREPVFSRNGGGGIRGALTRDGATLAHRRSDHLVVEREHPGLEFHAVEPVDRPDRGARRPHRD